MRQQHTHSIASTAAQLCLNGQSFHAAQQVQQHRTSTAPSTTCFTDVILVVLHPFSLPVFLQVLPPPAKCLLMRLLLRKRTWFALDSLSYPDVPDTAAAAAQLAGAGLIGYVHEPGADLAGLLPQLPAAVLKQLLGVLLPRNHPGLVAARAARGSSGAAGGQEAQTAKAAMLASIQVNTVAASRMRVATGLALCM
jgi:hypothetical protein